MALTLGTNVGFVLTAPTTDPNGTAVTSDGSSFVVKDTAPAGAIKITEVGWYKASGTTSSNTQVGLYSDNAGVADVRLQVTGDQASGTSAGWIVFSGLSWTITPGTAYWLGMQQDAHTGSSQIDSATSGGSGIDTRTSQTALTNPYGGGAVSDADGMYAIYAKYQSAPTVSLSSPADAATVTDTTPDLTFTGTDAQSDDIRYLVQIYQPVATDDFNRADNSSTGMNLGANWTASVPNYDLGISSNQAYQTADTSDNVAFYNATLNDDQYAQVTISTATDTYSGLVVRASATDYVIGQGVDGSTGLDIYWYNGGAYTQIATTDNFDVVSGDVLTLTAVGTRFTLYKNGVRIISGTNASAPSSGKAGIVIDNNGDRLDNFECGNIIVDAISGTDAGFSGTGGTIRASNLTSYLSDTDATSYTTSSISPTSNCLIIASVTSSKGSTPDTPTLSGNGLTWVQIATNNFDSAGTQRTLTLFRAMGSSPSSGAVTADFGGATQTACTIVINEFSGVDISGTNGSGAVVQYATNAEASQAANTFTVTLGAFGSSKNGTFGVASNGDASNFTVGTGFTSIGSSITTTPVINTLAEFRNDNDTTVTFEGAIGYSSGGIAIEIKSASPFESGAANTYTVQSALTDTTTYYWRVIGIDPSGSNTYGAWSTPRSFYLNTAGGGTVVQDIIGGFGFIPFAR